MTKMSIAEALRQAITVGVDFDTAVVRRLREAGFVFLGKTNTPEFGTTAFTAATIAASSAPLR